MCSFNQQVSFYQREWNITWKNVVLSPSLDLDSDKAKEKPININRTMLSGHFSRNQKEKTVIRPVKCCHLF
jgi:hypothetical protein